MKEITDLERKMCLGKTKHKSPLAANNQLDNISLFQKNKRHQLDVYKCRYCQNWHVGKNNQL